MHGDHTSHHGWTTRAHSRRHALSVALGTLGGLVGARFLPSRRASQQATTQNVVPATGGPMTTPMTTPMTMPMTMPMADIVGEVDHGRNGFNPSEILTDFDAGEVGKLPNGQTVENHVGIANFVYLPGDLTSSGPLGQPPTFQQGQPITFDNYDDGEAIYHTITACKDPCNGSTGISYPLANGPVRFDSGQLGYGPSGFTAAANTSSWALPTRNLKPGTYTFFCRIHPFMRGAFRVVK